MLTTISRWRACVGLGDRLRCFVALMFCVVLGSEAVLARQGTQQDPGENDPEWHAEPGFNEQTAANLLGLKEATLLRLTITELAEGLIEVEFPLDGELTKAALKPHSVRSPDYEARVYHADGTFDFLPPGAVKTLRGDIEGHPDAQIGATLIGGGIRAGIYLEDGSTRWIEPLSVHSEKAPPDLHVMYRGEDVISDGRCDHASIARPETRGEDRSRFPIIVIICDLEVCVADLAADLDPEFILACGGLEPARERVEELLNIVNLQFEPETEIRHELKTVILRETDPYPSTAGYSLLEEVGEYWRENHGDIDRDVVQLFTGRELDGYVIGWAFPKGICSEQYGYGVSQTLYRPTVAHQTDLIAHELGHNWGADHCSCPRFTMNWAINGSNRFHPNQTVPEIVATRRESQCLGAGQSDRVALPLDDRFAVTGVDRLLWALIGEVEINDGGMNPPSGPNCLNLDGRDYLQSVRFNASESTDLVLSYYWQRKGRADAPEAGDDLVVEFTADGGGWREIRRHPGDGPNLIGFTHEIISLGELAEHRNLRVRFRTFGSEEGFDDWFIDDVHLDGVPAPPGEFSLIRPAHDETAVQRPVRFEWAPSRRAQTYTLVVDDDPSFTSPVLQISTPHPEFVDEENLLSDATRYYWRVSADNRHGESHADPGASSFVTTLLEPGPFELLSPQMGEFVHQSSLSFAWTPSDRAASYLLEVDEDFELGSPEVSVVVVAGEQVPIEVFDPTDFLLPSGGTVYWSVTAQNAAGETLSTPALGSFQLIESAAVVCFGDADGNDWIDVNDLNLVLSALGQASASADVDASGMVDVNDLVAVIYRLGTNCR